ncbi:MAG: S1 RNA-binding domain-containing protein [Rhodopirellula sp.]|nr:S1 RNA-binding domain-containing protein [Rhodopirellula sp.]
MPEPVTINLRHLAHGLDIPLERVQSVVELLDEGNTVPFITRYRRDQTGGLDEEAIRRIQSRLTRMRLLAERKQTILRSIQSQGKLNEDLANQIRDADTTKRLEDLYLPYKPRKQTLATTGRSRGLEPLAEEILRADPACADLDARAADYANPDRKIPTGADALLGAGHILAERFSEMADLRQKLRDILERTGKLVTTSVTAEKPSEKASSRGKSPFAGQSGREVSLEAQPETFVMLGSSLPVESLETGWPEAFADTEVVRAESSEPLVEELLLQVDAACPQQTVMGTESGEVALEQHSDRSETAAELDVVSPVDPPASSGDGGGEPEDSTPGDPIDKEPVRDEASRPANADATEAPAAAEARDADRPSDSDLAPPATAQATAAISSAEQASATEAAAALLPEVLAARARAAKSKRKKVKAQKAEQKRLREEHKKRVEERLRKSFSDYFEFSEELVKLPPHRILAINRGERAKVLRVKIECDLEAMHRAVDEMCVPPEHPHAEFLRGCARDALVRLILPSLEREVRRELTEEAEQHAVDVFARNLRSLLLQRPVHGRRVLAVDPGYKSGCKLVALDQFGNVLAHQTVYLVGAEERRLSARRIIAELIDRYQLGVIAIGNGTGGRSAEDFISSMLAEELKEKGVSYVMVNEAGASVYSTSPSGREEFPGYDASLRGAISIGRRLQDPLSELVKIEPASIGVGMYQHDVKAKHLQASLDEVVESCVNYVGVEVNSASPALLRYVSGLNQLTARRVYEHRMQHGPFRNREQLREVAGFGEATFVQAAGFLKVSGGDQPLDVTWIHPECYEIAGSVLAKLEATPDEIARRDGAAGLSERVARVDVPAMAKELGVGELSLQDILRQLARPGRDPREDLPPPAFKKGVLKLEDLAPGMELTGTVLNVVDFGAFVDIGMHDIGLVHVSRLADRFVNNPHEVVSVGDIVRVWVVDVEKQRRRVSLTMIPPGAQRSAPPRRGKPAESAAERPARPRQNRGDRGKPPRRGQGQGQGRPAFEHQPKPKPKPAPPITEEMKAGKSPMRSFSDLAQFFQGQQPGALPENQDGKDEKDKKKKKK